LVSVSCRRAAYKNGMGGGNETSTAADKATRPCVTSREKTKPTKQQDTLTVPTVRRRRASSAGERLHRRRHKKQCSETPVVHVSETHDYMQSWNPYITEGYRLCASYKECLLSLFYYHNCWWDTITALFNIVHSLLLFNYIHDYHLDDEDKFVFGCFFLTAWIHSLPSAAYHLIGCSGKSYMEYIFYQRLDFVFIFVSSIPLSIALGWYTFYWQPMWLWLSVGGVVAMTLYTLRVIQQEMTSERRLRLVGGLVFFYFIPIFYSILTTLLSYAGWWSSLSMPPVSSLSYSTAPCMWWALAAIASLTMGAYTYGARFPECVIPNFPFSSHSWMHLGVNLAYFSEFFFIVHHYWLVKRHPQIFLAV